MEDWWEELNEVTRGIIISFFVVFLVTGLLLGYQKTFGVQFENVRRDQYTHTQSYVEGSIRDLNNLCLDLAKGDPAQKQILQDTIRNRYVQLDPNDIPTYLRPCLNGAREAK